MPVWDFVLCEPGGGGAELVDLDTAFNKSLKVSLGDGSEGTFSLASGSNEEVMIQMGAHDIKAYRNGELMGRGRIISAERSGGEDSVRTFKFVGYKQLLDNKKVLGGDVGAVLGYTGIDLEEAAWNLIYIAQQRAAGAGATGYNITRDGTPTGRVITGYRKFEVGSTVREAIDSMSQTITATGADDSFEWDIVAQGDQLVFVTWRPRRGKLPFVPDLAMEAGTILGKSLPTKVTGMYWPKYQHTLDLATITSKTNLVYLFQAGPPASEAGTYPTGSGAVVLIGEGGSAGDYAYQPDAWWLSQVQLLRARGTAVFLSVGGAGAYVDLSTTTKRDACLASIKSIYTRVGGFDGVDFNLETTETGTAVYPTNMVYIAQQLKLAYGDKFAFSCPVAQHITAPYIQHDIDIITAMIAANCMDFVAPQIYDGFQTMTESQKITLVNTVMNFWADYVGNDWSKLGIGFRTVGTSAEAMSVASAYVAYDLLANEHPNIRGAFHFDAVTDYGQSWLWANTLQPRINATSSTQIVPQPIDLADDFSTATASWTKVGNATVTGGLLTMTPTGYGTGPNQATTASPYNMSIGTTRVKIGSPPTAVGTTSGGVTVYEAFMSFILMDPVDANKYVNMSIFSGQTTTDLQVEYRNGAGDTAHFNYNLGYKSTDKYFRFFVNNGYLLLSAAPDVSGIPGAWRTKWLASTSEVPPLTSMKVRLKSDGYGTGATWDAFGYVDDGSETAPPTYLPPGGDGSETIIYTGPSGTVSGNKADYFFDSHVNVLEFSENFDYSGFANYITVQGSAGTDAVQKITFAAPTSGGFQIGFNGNYTPVMTWAVSIATMQAWIEALPGIGTGNIEVTGGLAPKNGPRYVRFIGELARKAIPLLTVQNNTLSPSTLTISTTVIGTLYSASVSAPGYDSSPHGIVEYFHYDDKLSDTISVNQRANYLLSVMSAYKPSMTFDIASDEYNGRTSFWLGDYVIVDLRDKGYQIYRTDLRISAIDFAIGEDNDEAIVPTVEHPAPVDRTESNLGKRIAAQELLAKKKSQALTQAKMTQRRALQAKLAMAEKNEAKLKAQKVALEKYYHTHGDKKINKGVERNKVNQIAAQIKASNTLQKNLKAQISKLK